MPLAGFRIRKSASILSDFLALSFGSFGSQVISIACVYILANKFGPEIFGSFSLFLAYTSIIVIFSSLSYEQAFPSLKGESFDSMVYLTTILAIISSLIAYFFAVFLEYSLAYALGFFVLANSLGRLGELMAVRAKLFRVISTFRVIPNILFMLSLLYLVWIESFILDEVVWFNLISFSLCWLGLYALAFFLQIASLPSLKGCMEVLISEKKFAFFVAPSQIFNRLAFNLPLILIDNFYGSYLLGQYALIQRIGFGPVSLIGSAISQIFLGYLGDLKRGDADNDFDFPFYAVKRNLIIAGLCIVVGFALVLPLVIPIIFTEDWDVAVKIGILLAPCLGATLIAYPLTAVFTVDKMHRYLFFNQLAYCLIAGLSFIGGLWGADYLHCIFVYSLLTTARYLVLFLKANAIIKQKMELI